MTKVAQRRRVRVAAAILNAANPRHHISKTVSRIKQHPVLQMHPADLHLRRIFAPSMRNKKRGRGRAGTVLVAALYYHIPSLQKLNAFQTPGIFNSPPIMPHRLIVAYPNAHPALLQQHRFKIGKVRIISMRQIRRFKLYAHLRGVGHGNIPQPHARRRPAQYRVQLNAHRRRLRRIQIQARQHRPHGRLEQNHGSTRRPFPAQTRPQNPAFLNKAIAFVARIGRTHTR